MSDSAFSLFTSLRYDVALQQVPARGLDYAGWNHHTQSPFYMLDYHRDRILKAAVHWQWKEAVEKLSGDDALVQLARVAQEAIGSTSDPKPLRLRIVVDSNGDIAFQHFDTPALPLENLLPKRLPNPGSAPGPNEPKVPPRFTLVVDDDPTPRSEFTHFKTTKRVMYDAARQRAGITDPRDQKEVLIINDKSVMEGSTTTPYFWRSGRWVTPPVSPIFSWDDGCGGQDGTSRRWALQRGLAVEQAVPVDSLVDGEECWISSGVSGFRLAVVSLRRTA
ncbi:amino-transferase class IV domain-containing protein [Hirsutella rhossiliensis]|uniref:Amino-transferase class IV domain-containing protein n=1 Tax=Hirsutella rhossiliensis TaxID=111463 RepID=A0A9P8N6A9_9HYPO|nr:amino-transferase class IV domain-containing protein [Hirsutella rhossiliensis]KAH0967740.1 amino-transferase class IV domain-containing protein [Hirsutella rhossiliensis]